MPEDPALQSILIAGIAEKIVQNLERRKALTVHSLKTVSFASESLEGRSTVESQRSIRDPCAAIESLRSITVQVAVEAVMTRNSMRAIFRRPAAAQSEMILELTTRDGQPMFQETHWYTDKQAYLRGEPYAISDPSGVKELKVEHTMFAEIQAQGVPVCTLAEFFYSWLGRESLFAKSVPRGIGQSSPSDTVTTEQLGEAEVFHVKKLVYDVSDASSRSTRTDHYSVTKDFKLVAWRIELSHLKYGSKASYMVEANTYSYPSDAER